MHGEGYGDFNLEWHLVGDIKTLKSMYGYSNVGNAKMPFLFCMRQMVVDGNGRKHWVNEGRFGGAPTWDAQVEDANGDMRCVDETWDPVLPIPLKRVHFCTLHTFVCIIEKLLLEYIHFAYNIKFQEASDKARRDLEKVLSKIGLHGGNVVIKKDEKNKVHIETFQVSLASGVPMQENILQHQLMWTVVCQSIFLRDMMDGKSYTMRFWIELMEVLQERQNQMYGLNLTNYHPCCKSSSLMLTMLKVMSKSFTMLWSQVGVHKTSSPYMHILLVHGPYYGTEGSLAT